MINELTPEQEAELKAKWLEELKIDEHNMQIKLSAYPQKATITPYLITVVAVVLIAVAGSVVVVSITPGQDNSALIIQIFGISAVVVPLIFNLIKAQEFVAKQDATHVMMNSRLSALLDATQKASFKEGEAAGRKASDARTDALAAANPVGTVVLTGKIKTGPLNLPPHEPPKDTGAK